MPTDWDNLSDEELRDALEGRATGISNPGDPDYPEELLERAEKRAGIVDLEEKDEAPDSASS